MRAADTINGTTEQTQNSKKKVAKAKSKSMGAGWLRTAAHLASGAVAVKSVVTRSNNTGRPQSAFYNEEESGCEGDSTVHQVRTQFRRICFSSQKQFAEGTQQETRST
jgi:hypothetical protein